jgi:hypothetical protein
MSAAGLRLRFGGLTPALFWPTYVYWLAILLTLVSLGGGVISIDAILGALYRREQTIFEG